jgi:hypothetical protein
MLHKRCEDIKGLGRQPDGATVCREPALAQIEPEPAKPVNIPRRHRDFAKS